MILTPLFRTVGRVVAAVGIVTGLLLGGAATAAAEEVEKPYAVDGYAKAPGWITVTWEYDGDRYDVAVFVIRRQNLDGATAEERATVDAGWADAGRSDFTDKFLKPNTRYRYFVCAIGDDRSYGCSELSPPIRTQPLPSPTPSGGTAGVTLPAAVATPVLRVQRASLVEAYLTWDLPPSGSVVLTRGTLYRNNQAIYEALQPGNYDSDHVDQLRHDTTYRYKFCFEGPAFGKRCSKEVVVQGPVTVPNPAVDPSTPVRRNNNRQRCAFVAC